jgi:CRP/FNR family transcriptional regulator, anaerobic regulatory protein
MSDQTRPPAAAEIPGDRFGLHRPELSASLARGDAKLLERMASTAEMLPAGRVLIRSDTPHDYIYRLRSGWACRSRATNDGREQLILIFLPGDLFAVKSMIVPLHVDSVRILSDAVVERIHREDLLRLCAEDVDISHRCLMQVVEEERRLHSSVFGLGQGSAEERMARFLTEVRGRLIAASEMSRAEHNFPVPLTQEQLGDLLGITGVHVNRVLKVFRTREIATLREGQAYITNFQELGRLAAPLLDAYERTAPSYQPPAIA